MSGKKPHRSSSAPTERTSAPVFNEVAAADAPPSEDPSSPPDPPADPPADKPKRAKTKAKEFTGSIRLLADCKLPVEGKSIVFLKGKVVSDRDTIVKLQSVGAKFEAS